MWLFWLKCHILLGLGHSVLNFLHFKVLVKGKAAETNMLHKWCYVSVQTSFWFSCNFFFSLTGQIKWSYMGSDTPTHVLKPPHYILISWAKATVCQVWVFSPLKLCHETLVVLCYERVWRVNKTWRPQRHGHVHTGHSQPDIASWFKTPALIACY